MCKRLGQTRSGNFMIVVPSFFFLRFFLFFSSASTLPSLLSLSSPRRVNEQFKWKTVKKIETHHKSRTHWMTVRRRSRTRAKGKKRRRDDKIHKVVSRRTKLGSWDFFESLKRKRLAKKTTNNKFKWWNGGAMTLTGTNWIRRKIMNSKGTINA